jgi:lipopolysaccharide transport system permease protein
MMEQQVRVYSADTNAKISLATFKLMFSDLRKAHGLAYQWSKRDITSQYRESYFGILWAFIGPLVNAGAWILMQWFGIIKLESTGMPYAAFVFSGTIMWQIFTEAVSTPLSSINAAKSILSKLNFPREAVLLNGIYKGIFNTIIKVVILIPVMILIGVYPDWKIIFFPFLILTIILVGNTIGMFLIPMGSLFNDIGRMVPIATRVLMFVTPVVYAIPENGTLATIFHWNFMTPLITTGRDLLNGNSLAYVLSDTYIILFSFVLLLLGWFMVKKTLPTLIERMDA